MSYAAYGQGPAPSNPVTGALDSSVKYGIVFVLSLYAIIAVVMTICGLLKCLERCESDDDDDVEAGKRSPRGGTKGTHAPPDALLIGGGQEAMRREVGEMGVTIEEGRKGRKVVEVLKWVLLLPRSCSRMQWRMYGGGEARERPVRLL